jgi:uncharacterized protein
MEFRLPLCSLMTGSDTKQSADYRRGGEMARIETLEQLDALYGVAKPPAMVKVADCITSEYRQFIEAAPFLALATSGPEGLDCSPRGDLPGFVRVRDEKTLLLPDRHGNNRIDSLRNIVRDSRISLMFMIPGVANVIRINGHAILTNDPDVLASFAVKGKQPRSVIELTVVEVYFQCARAIMRSRLWDAEVQINPDTLPTPGQILSAMSDGKEGGTSYDDAWAGRAEKTMW